MCTTNASGSVAMGEIGVEITGIPVLCLSAGGKIVMCLSTNYSCSGILEQFYPQPEFAETHYRVFPYCCIYIKKEMADTNICGPSGT